MPTFSYSSGSTTATIDAPDRSAALRQLVARGVVPAAISEVRSGAGAGKAGGIGALFGRRVRAVTLAELASLIRELSTALQAGLPLVPALRTIRKARKAPGEVAMLEHLIDKVEHGSPLAEACRSWGKPFDDLTCNLIKAGEASGKLAEVLEQNADLLDKQLAMRRAIIGATVYPGFLAFLILVAVVVTSVVIVPNILKPLQDSNTPLPLPTRVLKGSVDFVMGYWWLIGLGIAGLALGWTRLRANPASREVIDGWMLRLPLVGPMLTEAIVARFSRTFSTLIGAGLPALSALRLSGGTVTNLAMRRAVRSVADEVAGGKTIAEPLEKTGFFPPLLVQIVALGERSGRLGQLLRQVTTALEERTSVRIALFTRVIEPLLIVIGAVFVGFVIAAILMAMLAMQDAIGGAS
jgi:type II secretory pathway component PulF